MTELQDKIKAVLKGLKESKGNARVWWPRLGDFSPRPHIVDTVDISDDGSQFEVFTDITRGWPNRNFIPISFENFPNWVQPIESGRKTVFSLEAIVDEEAKVEAEF